MLVMDVETTGLLKDPTAIVTCGVGYSTRSQRFGVYGHQEADRLVDSILDDGVVSGYNIYRFDIPFLERQTRRSLNGVRVLDPFQFILKHTGKMVGLDTVLGWVWDSPLMRKSDSGINAIELWRQGKVEELRSYCAMDVWLETALVMVAITEGIPVGGKQLVMSVKDALTYQSTALVAA